MIPANVISALLVVVAAYLIGDISPMLLFVWFVSVSLLSAWRMWYGRIILQQKISDENIGSINKAIVVGSSLAGLIWGLGFAGFASGLPWEYQLAFLWVLGGLATSTQSSLSYIPAAYQYYLVSMLLPALCWYISEFTLQGIGVAGFILIFMIIASIASRKYSKNALEVIQLRFEQNVLRDNNEPFYASLFDLAPDAVIAVNGRQEVSLYNKVAEQMFGYDAGELLGLPLGQLVPKRMRKAHPGYVKSFSESGETHRFMDQRGAIFGLRKDGGEFPCEVSIAQIELSGQKYFAATIRDLTRQKEAEEEIFRLAMYDPLTGLYNRTRLHQLLESLLMQMASGSKLAVCLVGINRFKAINEILGRKAGDAVLKQAAAKLASFESQTVCVSRLGGDVFALLISGPLIREQIVKLSHDITQLFLLPVKVDDVDVDVSVSIGIALAPEDGKDSDDLLTRADVALNHAKNEKKGFLFYYEGMGSYDTDHLYIAGELKRCIANSELELHYQPKIDIVTREISAVEALIRWRHPEKGLISPSLFIPIAEQIGLISGFTCWVLEQGIRDLKSWHDQGVLLGMSINLSTQDLEDSGLIGKVAQELERCGCSPSYLTLEITESDLMVNPEHSKRTLKGLRALGVKLSIDDFGTGYSSLAYLNELEVDELKVDKSFVTDMALNEKHATIVRAVVHLAHDLGLSVTAEGIETPDALSMLEGFQCGAAQGILIGQPMPADLLLTRLQEIPWKVEV